MGKRAGLSRPKLPQLEKQKREIQAENGAVLRFPFFAPRLNGGPIPDVGIFDDPIRYAQINAEWASHALAVLETLDQPDAWGGTEKEIENARQEIRRFMA